VRVLLDTHVFLWTLSGSPRIEPVRDLILSEESDVYVSAASLWEIAIKSSLGKLKADVVELRAASRASGFGELPVTGLHAEALAQLPRHHTDPFDRLLVAQAMAEPMRLLTADTRLAGYGELIMTF
jgi:PIN domain nuclease of toxin-antitoxin system